MLKLTVLLIIALEAGQGAKPSPPEAQRIVPAGQDRARACRATGRSAGEAITVHGHLYAADGGGSGYRIRVVGSKRILWVTWRVMREVCFVSATRRVVARVHE